MTARLPDEQLDREIRGFLATRAEQIAGAPTATEMAARLGSPARARSVSGSVVLRLSPQLAWALLGLLLVVALAAAAVGAIRPRPAVVVAPSPAPSSESSPSPTSPTAGSPGNGWIAYSTRAHNSTTGAKGDIFLTHAGEVPKRIDGDNGVVTVCPSFSPDGMKLLWVEGENVITTAFDATGAPQGGHADGLPGLVSAVCPTWSPSGKTIAALWGADIVLLSLDHEFTPVHLPEGRVVSFSDGQLAWSPDGTKLLLAMNTGIYLVPIDGSTATRVSTALALSLSWSPDGSRIAFEEEGAPGTLQVSVLTLDTGGQVVGLGPGRQPLWSPAGDRIAFKSDAFGVVVERPDGSERRVIDPPNAYDLGGWSPDGLWLLEMVDISGYAWDLVAVPVDGGAPTVVMHDIATGGRNFPGRGDVSWQVVYR